MQLGIDCLIGDPALRSKLKGRRLALLAHPASMTAGFEHSVDALMQCRELKLVAAFGPQHGMRGDKQDNMIESEDYLDPIHRIPVFSLYGRVRRPTPEMMERFDVLLVDLQDLGCRIYTFLTTLLYVMEACARSGKTIWVLDRPNPAGRPVEGTLLEEGWESFVGAGPLPMRHGLTLAEAALWFKRHFRLDLDLHIVKMREYDPKAAPGYGWPIGERSWVNPSPNASSWTMARCYSGTVLIEGTHFSEGRGTTKPLEMIGAPDLEIHEILAWMKTQGADWIRGCRLRPCYFEPTFQKHAGKLCQGFQMHVDDPAYRQDEFKPYRLVALWLKAVRTLHPEYNIWRSFPYEYEAERLAIDLINGGTGLRSWVDSPKTTCADLEKTLSTDEQAWRDSVADLLLY